MSGKSKEEIAFDLVSKLKGVGVWGEHNKAEILDMYALCLEATSGLRTLDGREPSALRLQGTASKPAKPAPAQTAQPILRPTGSHPAPTPPAVPQQPVAQQPQVRQQQQMVQQAYQQQIKPG